MTPVTALLRRTIVPVTLVGVGAGVLAAWITARQPAGVEATLTFTIYPPVSEVLRRGTGERGDSVFETLRAADVFADTVAGWLSAPEFVAEVYRRAQHDVPQTSISRLGRTFIAQKRGSQSASVRFRAPSSADAEALTKAAVAEVAERTDAFNRETQPLAFRVVAAEPLILPVRPAPLLRGAVAGMVAFIFALNAVLLWDILRESPGVR